MSPDYSHAQDNASAETKPPKPNGHAAASEGNTADGTADPGSSGPNDAVQDRNSSLTDDELIAKARSAKNGSKFTKLWQGCCDGYQERDDADSALCMILAYWTGNDADRMDRLFRRSSLMRPRWDFQVLPSATYGQDVIAHAISKTTEVFPGIQKRKEIDDARRKISTLLGQAKKTKDVSLAYNAAQLIPRLPAADAGPIKAEFKKALGSRLNMNDFHRAISEATRELNRSAQTEESGLPAIEISDRPLRDISDEALDALYRFNHRQSRPQIYVRANTLVRVAHDEAARPLPSVPI